MELNGKRVLVLGLGDTGLSMAKWLAGRGACLRVADSRARPPGAGRLRAAVPAAELHLGAWRDDSFQGVDLIAISPGVPRETAQLRRAMDAGTPVMGDIELFARALPGEADRASSPLPGPMVNRR